MVRKILLPSGNMAKKPVKAPKKKTAVKKTVVKKEKPAKSAKPVKLDKSLIDPLRQAAKSSAARRTMR